MIQTSTFSIYPLSNHIDLAAGRTALILSYEGARYYGWQAQRSGLPTIQSALEKALSKVAAEDITVVCAGRTDAGVNATQQVVHFDSTVCRSPYSWVTGGNHFLPKDIALLWAGPVKAEFHARYTAMGRTYRYIIHNAPVRSALASESVSWIYQPLDTQAMQEAAQCLLGENDFSAFRGADCQSKTPFRCVEEVSVIRKGELVILEVTANAFLHHMVRNIAGTLIEVGAGKKPKAWVQEVLACKVRSRGGATASPHGLYLVKVDYPPSFGLPELPLGPFFLGE